MEFNSSPVLRPELIKGLAMTDDELLKKIRHQALPYEFSSRYIVLELARRYEVLKTDRDFLLEQIKGEQR